jgi:hypothetical protein
MSMLISTKFEIRLILVVISLFCFGCDLSDQVDSNLQTAVEESAAVEAAVPDENVAALPNSEDTSSSAPSSDLIGNNISSESGYVWETVDNSADIYTALSFNGNEFKIASYSMNSSSNPKDFTRAVDFSGTWTLIGHHKVEGVFSEGGTVVDWTFNDDFTSMINSNGVEFRKVLIS